MCCSFLWLGSYLCVWRGGTCVLIALKLVVNSFIEMHQKCFIYEVNIHILHVYSCIHIRVAVLSLCDQYINVWATQIIEGTGIIIIYVGIHTYTARL
jgi:hypothetical protein